MKGILEFNLPKDDIRFEIAIKAPHIVEALWTFFQEDLGPVIKHGSDDVERAFAEKWRDALVKRLQEEGVLELV